MQSYTRARWGSTVIFFCHSAPRVWWINGSPNLGRRSPGTTLCDDFQNKPKSLFDVCAPRRISVLEDTCPCVIGGNREATTGTCACALSSSALIRVRWERGRTDGGRNARLRGCCLLRGGRGVDDNSDIGTTRIRRLWFGGLGLGRSSNSLCP
jgi:hypothetical protein